jgi:multidrug efflux pump subunit AcrB
MLKIVRLALTRPYTFIVLALLILVIGPLSALRTPTDIFPDIRIPVISVVWNYAGLQPDDMAGRIVTYYERTLGTTVNDVEHIESQSFRGYGIVKIFFQPTVDIRTATAQVTSVSQTVLKQMPPGTTPPQILNYSASTVPVLQLALTSNTLDEQKLADYATNFIRPQLLSVPGVAIPNPYGGKTREVQIDLDPQALQEKKLSAQDVANALAQQNQIIPAGTEKIGRFEYNIKLNNSPLALQELNALPIKTVDGATIYIRDVAHVRDGYPPQINIVRVDGHRAVLMSILKNGSASTLDIIAGVKAKLPLIEETLPPGLKLVSMGDQSTFVKGAVSGVAREGVIAAALTSLMILLFLGSWRSTLIIAASIPLAVLAAIAGLSAMGETLNVMTLGGLALAVGILVDDATVTIENINWHLEQGKDVRSAIMDGAAQIVGPAFVSLLCICIVFVPMLLLNGIARFLFVPMAEAVIFAMVASFVLSRTFVPMLAQYLLRPHASGGHASGELAAVMDPHGGHHHAPPSRNPLVRFQRGFEQRFERVRGVYQIVLGLALTNRKRFVTGFLIVVGASFLLAPWLGRNFFPNIDSGAITLHVRAPIGTRIEDTAEEFDHIEDAVRRLVPPDQLANIVDNVGLPNSGINLTYNNSGTTGPEDGDIMVSLNENHAPTDGYVKRLRESLPREFPGTTFSFLPADIVSQILNFGAPAPIDLQVAGYAHPAGLNLPAVHGIGRSLTRRSTGHHRAGRHQLRGGEPLRHEPGGTHVLVKSQQRGVISDRGANAGIPDAVALGAEQSAHHRQRRPIADPRRHRHHRARRRRCGRLALQHRTALRRLCHHPGPRSRRGGLGYPAHPAGDGKGRTEGFGDHLAWPGADDEQRVPRSLARPCWRDPADLHADRRELPLVGRRVRDRHRVARGARRDRLDVVHHPYAAFGAGTHRRDSLHGRRDREQHSGGELRPRASRGDRQRTGRRDGSWLHALPAGVDDCARDDHRHGADGARPRRWRRTERAARPCRDRRPDLRDLRHAAVRTGCVQPRAPSRCGEVSAYQR